MLMAEHIPSSLPSSKAIQLCHVLFYVSFLVSYSDPKLASLPELLLASHLLFLALLVLCLLSRSVSAKCHTWPDSRNKTVMLVVSISGGNDKSLQMKNNRATVSAAYDEADEIRENRLTDRSQENQSIVTIICSDAPAACP